MIYIGVGSNLGDRWAALSEAWQRLEALGVHIRASSPVYETLPWGEPDQPLYLNAVWEAQTGLAPEELLCVLQAVEQALGRPSFLRSRWGARVIDLDLLAYGGESRSSAKLMLPHPWIPYRAFVLGPWKDLAPYFYLAKWHATVGELWRRSSFSDWGYRVNPPDNLPLPLILSPVIPPPGGALKLSIEAIARGDTSEALRLAERAIALNAEAPFPYELKGYYHYMRGEDTLAIWYYRQALERGGGSATLHYRLGSAYLMQKRWADAHYHLQRALILDSTMNDAWVALGLWAYLQRRFDSAEIYWRKALARDSTHDKARSFLYDLYLNQHNQPDTARKYFLDPYWRLNRFNPLLNFQLGNYYLKKLMMVPDLPANDKIRATYAFQAVQAYSQAILAHPTYVGAYYNRGYVHFLVKKYDRALEDFVRAVELDPKDARTHFMIGSIREVKGDYVRAREAYQRAVELRPDFTEAQEALRQLSSQTQ